VKSALPLDPKSLVERSKLNEIQQILAAHFPAAIDDVLLQVYPCQYSSDPSVFIRGEICIGRNAIYFRNLDEIASDFNISILYRDVNALELLNAKRVLLPDSIIIETKEQQVLFSLILDFFDALK
jgi:hypothetical protein